MSDFIGTYLNQKLPEGEYQVIIRAERNYNLNVSSGVVLDNIFIMPNGTVPVLLLYLL